MKIMKKTIAVAICATMTAAIISASAAEPVYGNSTSELPAPSGYLCLATEVETPDGYGEEGVLAEPLVAYTWAYLDEIALGKGYVIQEPQDGVFRAYTRKESGRMVHVVIEADLATACVHSDSELPGAMMGVWCHANKTTVYSTVDIANLLI